MGLQRVNAAGDIRGTVGDGEAARYLPASVAFAPVAWAAVAVPDNAMV